MSSSSEATVVRGLPAGAVHTPPLTTELRTGTWTRLGDKTVLGDGVTESAMQALAETTMTSARAQGYSVGWSQGRHAAEKKAREAATAAASRREADDARREEEHQSAVVGLRRAAEQLTATTAQVCASVESQAVDIAMALTETLVGRELELAQDPGADAVRRAMSLLPAQPLVTLRLHPDDVPSPAVADLVHAGAQVVADPTVQRGDALAEADTFVVDASIATALKRVREVLRECRQ
jgi:flagellar assembly protein FliH